MATRTDTDGDWQRTWHDLWAILGCKWTFHVIRVLSTDDAGLGFNEIRRRIDDITPTMLARRLDQLEREGIVAKSIVASSPPASNYTLTETGEALADLLVEIERLHPGRE